MLSRRTFSIVFISYDNRTNFCGLVSTLGCWYFTVRTSQLVFHRVGGIVVRIDSSDKHVVGDVVQMASVLQPRTCHGDVVRGTFSFGFDQQFQSFQVHTFPSCE